MKAVIGLHDCARSMVLDVGSVEWKAILLCYDPDGVGIAGRSALETTHFAHLMPLNTAVPPYEALDKGETPAAAAETWWMQTQLGGGMSIGSHV